MLDNNFKITKTNGTIIIEKNGKVLSISQAPDDDVWFTTSEEELSLELSMYSRNHLEWQTYILFENLMKTIVGRYVLNDDKNEYSRLPKDFIDLDNNIITWHSDGEVDNILTLRYDGRTIKIMISKSNKAEYYYTNGVRIRTNGSNYGYYYQEFLDFFKCLSEIECKLNKYAESTELETKKVAARKKLSLFKKKK